MVGVEDEFLTASIHGITQNKNNEEILEFVNSVGAFAVAHNGANPIWILQKLRNWKLIKVISLKEKVLLRIP
jgi:hypothetical protein